MPTYAQAQRLLWQRLEHAGVVSARSEAQQLLEQITQLPRLQLILKADHLLTDAQWQALQALATRRSQGEPLQHLLGFSEWAGLRLAVSPDALIPRPETEVLLELACQELRRTDLPPAPRVLDVGTGTGALALALKSRFPQAQVHASDISPEALRLAQRNAQQLGLSISWHHANLLAGVAGPFDLLVSNPPYLPDGDQPHLSAEVQRDPALALYGGPDGLDLAWPLCQQAPAVLAPGAALLLELDPRNVAVLAARLAPLGWQTQIHPDLTGRPRFLRAQPSITSL